MQTSQKISGLSTQEVAERRAAGQGAIMPPPTGRTYFQIIREDVFTFIDTILFLLCLALLLLGQYSEALISVGTVLFNVIISVIQEIRAKRKLDRIVLLTRPRAIVIREQVEVSLDPSELVVGDILRVQAGDQFVADGTMVSGGQVEVDESLLTGESELIPKQRGDVIFSGSFCVTGQGYYRAEKLGIESMAGQVTAGARSFRHRYTPLQRRINLLIQTLLLIAVYIEAIFLIIDLFDRTPFVETIRESIVIVGIVPIGLILATSVSYALGALRIAGQSVLIQRLSAVEALSNIDVLCLDKTGTITTNELALEKLNPLDISEQRLRDLLSLFVNSKSNQNATEVAIAVGLESSYKAGLEIREEIPFVSTRKWSALTFDSDEIRGTYVLGAPEVLASVLCPGYELDHFINAESERGMRVLLFACWPQPFALRGEGNKVTLLSNLKPLGLLSLRDQLRPHVQQTLADFARVGIKIKVISGDSPTTVSALSRQVGIAQAEKVISGKALEELDEAAFAHAVEEMAIFGRITPHQKERLVDALRSRGHYVAMIGDGVNDVFSLKRADLGIAMESGSSSARGVSDIVLLNDSFEALPQAFAEGQRIQNGMSNVIKLFLTRIAYLGLLLLTIPLVGGFPFAPKQKSLLTLITSSVITVALAAWAKPGHTNSQSFARQLLHFVVPVALSQSLVSFVIFQGALYLSQGANFAEDLRLAQSALTTFGIFSGLLLVPFVTPPTRFWVGGNELSGDWRPTLLALGLLVVFLIVVALPIVSGFFSLTPLSLVEYLFIGAVTLLWGLVQRWLWRARLLERFLQLDKD
ncbi:MAG TPA: HAD-IC family P-type ATPase [Ktedonobacteraceae bacterium]|nr:HAD-IC family P-type ATPase [Ktedonobacteraceae bacterium]